MGMTHRRCLAMTKLRSLKDAIRPIPSGTSVAIGGMLTYRRPMALVSELIRQSVQRLTLIGWTLGIETELLLSRPNTVSTIRSAYTGLDLFGMAPRFREMVESGRVSVIEETESTMGFGLRAALQNVGFMPARTLIGTDIMDVRPDIKQVTCPYTGEEYPAIPAVRPDVALIHVPICDTEGNAVICTNRGVDRELALLADYSVVSAEEVVEPGDPRLRDAAIIGRSVNTVVHAPGGAWPTSCYPAYQIDALALQDYVDAFKTGAGELIEAWLTRLQEGATVA